MCNWPRCLARDAGADTVPCRFGATQAASRHWNGLAALYIWPMSPLGFLGRSRLVRSLVALWLALCSASCPALSVVFISPGYPDEAYWVAAHQAMQSAAKSLGIRLEHHFTARDQARVMQIAREISQRPAAERPDFVVGTNDRRSLVAMARLLDAAGIQSFGAYSGLHGAEEAQAGPPRKGIRHLIGTLEPDAVEAGYTTAKALIEQGLRERRVGPDGKVHLLALAGDKSTPTSIYRNQGMERAVQDSRGQAVLEQMVYTGWDRKVAEEKTRYLLERYPQAQLIWSATDQIAFGAMQALRQRGGQPGRELLFSAINTSSPAMEALIAGDLASLSGGHFMAGAWSLVLLYDYAHGHDFAQTEGLVLFRPMFMQFDKESARRYLERFGAGLGGVDFRPYSKVLQPGLRRYDFRLSTLLGP